MQGRKDSAGEDSGMEVSVQNRRDLRGKNKQSRNGLEWRDEGI